MQRSNWSSPWRRRADSYAMQLRQLLERLIEAKIDFVVVGGYAAVLHGSTVEPISSSFATALSL